MCFCVLFFSILLHYKDTYFCVYFENTLYMRADFNWQLFTCFCHYY